MHHRHARPAAPPAHVANSTPLGRFSPRPVLAAALAAVLAVAGCGGAAGSDAASGAKVTTLTIAAGPVVDIAPIHLGIKQGLFRAEGLNVQLKAFKSGAEAAAALVGGKVDVSFGNYGSVYLARSQGIDLRIVGEASTATTGTIAVVALPKSKIGSGKDLTGKTISVTSTKGTPTAIVDSALRAAGANPKTVKYVEVPLDQVGAALTSGAIDAGYILEPYVTQLSKSLGARTVLDPVSGPTESLPLNGYAMTGKYADGNRQTVAAFQRALAKAQAAATRTAVQQILPTYTKIDADTAALMHLPNFPTSLNPTRLQRVADLMADSGQLTKPLTVADFTIVPAGT